MIDGGPAIECEVICAWPGQSWSVRLRLPAGATVADALAQARLLARQHVARQPGESPQIDWEAAVGVHGETCDRSRPLAHGDRIELYRPLAVDPKESRRRRAAAAPRSGRGGLRR